MPSKNDTVDASLSCGQMSQRHTQVRCLWELVGVGSRGHRDPPSKECCTLISGLADLEAALCLCTAIKANAVGAIKVKIPIAISLLINACGKKVPQGFACP
ncbi:hypothetical protein ES332_A12G117700v1 [Gossypium tomentosum]|uniref:Bifunctional inhibitor/plant lipid transfer protein/seed storage helical domain-containing protein n=1 Tax=Gossypium tomentosum TaxID=34277 RepID=A0A5D2MW75_GOSTO|nr:hypothetical protein ES332_A12G117700v1 [Gossypium tomentosum]